MNWAEGRASDSDDGSGAVDKQNHVDKLFRLCFEQNDKAVQLSKYQPPAAPSASSLASPSPSATSLKETTLEYVSMCYNNWGVALISFVCNNTHSITLSTLKQI